MKVKIKPRIGGHPLHMILVPFPSALYPMAVICSSIHYFTNDPVPGHVAFYAAAGGTFMAWIAIIFGIWESAFISAEKTKIITTVLWHATLNVIVTILFTIWTAKAWKIYPQVMVDSVSLLISKWLILMIFIAGNYIGGKLVIKYHLGIEENENSKKIAQLMNHLDQ